MKTLKHFYTLACCASLAGLAGCTSHRVVPIGMLDQQTGEAVMHRTILRDGFADGTRIQDISIDRGEDGYRLIRSGSRGNGKHLVESTPLTLATNGALMLRLGGRSDTCAGNNCSHCPAYDPRTGCGSCLKGTGVCEHSVTTTTGFLKPEFMTR